MSGYVPFDKRRDAVSDALHKHNMLIGLFCENLAQGRDGFAGLGQFAGSSDITKQGGGDD